MEDILRQWAPTASPVRIEYPAGLFERLAPPPDRDETIGVLWGRRTAADVRVAGSDARAGLQPVGVFSARIRGEVFLTEADLERLDTFKTGAIALVIAGAKAGFFVREADGSMQSIQSYQEIAIVPPATVPTPTPSRPKGTTLAALGGMLAIPLVASTCWPHPHPPRPLDLTVRDNAGQLRISWDAGTNLEIRDGGTITRIVARTLASATYARATSDVVLELTDGSRREIIHFLSPVPPPSVTRSNLRAAVTDLEQQRAGLRASIARDSRKIEDLQAAVDRLSGSATPEP